MQCEPTQQTAVGSGGLGKLFARRPNGLPASLGKEMLFGAWNHLKKTKDDCYMPAHDSLEHYTLLWDISANQMAAKYQCAEQGELVSRRGACRTGLRQLGTHSLTHRTPRKGGRRSHYLHFIDVEREVGEICQPRGSVGAEMSGYGSQLSALCVDCASWGTFGGRFLFLSHRREKKHLPASTKGIMPCWFVLRALLGLGKLEIHTVN